MGGTETYWNIAAGHIDDPRIQVALVNLEKQPTTKPNFISVVSNACDMHEFADMSYDLVHSSAVVENVGTWKDMERFAKNVRRLAPAYLVKSPYYWVPFEPIRALTLHWFPEQAQCRGIMSRDMDNITQAESVGSAAVSIQGCRLLDWGQYAELFPDSTVRPERVMGIIKSIMAVRIGG
jgi:hypothetical protein